MGSVLDYALESKAVRVHALGNITEQFQTYLNVHQLEMSKLSDRFEVDRLERAWSELTDTEKEEEGSDLYGWADKMREKWRIEYKQWQAEQPYVPEEDYDDDDEEDY